MWIAGAVLIVLVLVGVSLWWRIRERAGEREPEREAGDVGEPPGNGDPTWDPRHRDPEDGT